MKALLEHTVSLTLNVHNKSSLHNSEYNVGPVPNWWESNGCNHHDLDMVSPLDHGISKDMDSITIKLKAFSQILVDTYHEDLEHSPEHTQFAEVDNAFAGARILRGTI